jgi:hypothetical protein
MFRLGIDSSELLEDGRCQCGGLLVAMTALGKTGPAAIDPEWSVSERE